MNLGPEARRQWSLFVQVSQILVGSLTGASLLGYFLHNQFGLSALWTALLLFLALAVSLREILILGRKFDQPRTDKKNIKPEEKRDLK